MPTSTQNLTRQKSKIFATLPKGRGDFLFRRTSLESVGAAQRAVGDAGSYNL